MSNSIWKTPGFHEAIDNKLKVSKDGKWVYWTMYGWNRPGEDVHDIGVEWAYVEDVLAQADKAERLQKAVDLAIQRLEQGKQKFGKSKMGPNKEVAMLCEIVIDEIKQLIKENQ
jgi:hypothetical protein